MRFVHAKEEAVEKLHSLYPEFSSSRIIGDNSGWCNYAVVVDDTYIFRFPKNESALKSVCNEKKVLAALKGRLKDNIQIPEYIFSDLEGDYPFVGYRMIKGKHLSEQLFNEMNNEKQERILSLIKDFLNALHSLDYHGLGLDEKNPKTEFEPLYNEIRKVAYPHFTEEEKQATEELFHFYFTDERMSDYTPCVIHGDLSTDHIFITDDGIGIIDFGDVRVFDPAYDFIWAYFFEEEFYQRLIQRDSLEDYRIREFYYKRTPYYGIIYSIKMDNDEHFQGAMQFMHDILIK